MWTICFCSDRSFSIGVSAQTWAAVGFATLAIATLSYSAHKPWWMSGTFPSPVLFQIVFPWFKIAIRHENHQTNDAVQHGIHKYATIFCQNELMFSMKIGLSAHAIRP